MAVNAAKKQPGRGSGRPFEAGQSGNPSGKPRGARHATTILAERLLSDDVEQVVVAVLTAAKAGDMAAARIVLDRIAPVRKGAPIAFDLPRIETAEDVDRALTAIAGQMGDGALSPDEASAIAGVIELRRRAIETNLTEKRLTEIEARLKETSR